MDENRIVQAILVPDIKTVTENWGAYLALRASVLCYQRRTAEDIPMWDKWLAGQFTKTVRKYPVSKIAELKALPGAFTRTTPLNVDHPFIAFPPTTYADMEPQVRKCQVQGIEYTDKASYPSLAAYKKHKENEGLDIMLHINPHLGMSSGKIFAQVAHAGMLYALLNPLQAATIKQKSKFTDRILITKNPEIFDHVKTDLRIRDAGFTEVAEGSETVKIEILHE